MATTIYVLKLITNKWYVGKTGNIKYRFQQHLNGQGSSWTKKYKPVSIEKTIENASHFEEDKVTKEYMSKYGIDNVRGGSYCNIELDESQLELLKREIWGAQNKCAKCGRSGHFQDNCYAKTDVQGNYLEDLVWCCEKCNEEFDDKHECEQHEKYCKVCYRCGRSGHYSTNCYARTHIKGYYIA